MGFYKFNDDSGGQLLHLHSRYSEEKSAPAKTDFPTDYFSPKNVQHEVLLANLKEWAFGRRDDLCASGITEDMIAPLRKDLALSLLMDRSMKKLSTEVGSSNYIPHDTNMARMGIFLHALADHASHHTCTEVSYFYQNGIKIFDSIFAAEPCGQGNHLSWHAWEQGTAKKGFNDINYRTMEEALAQTWNILQQRGDQLGVVRTAFSEQQLLGIAVQLIEPHHYLPQPGHGMAWQL